MLEGSHIYIPGWVCDWAKLNDPKHRKHPGSYIREYLCQMIASGKTVD
jgi:hypothetical protein